MLVIINKCYVDFKRNKLKWFCLKIRISLFYNIPYIPIIQLYDQKLRAGLKQYNRPLTTSELKQIRGEHCGYS
jgi:hypothetical protein